LDYSGPSEGSVLVTADPYQPGHEEIIDTDDRGGFVDPADYSRFIF
jgi:hypothetical protein